MGRGLPSSRLSASPYLVEHVGDLHAVQVGVEEDVALVDHVGALEVLLVLGPVEVDPQLVGQLLERLHLAVHHRVQLSIASGTQTRRGQPRLECTSK